MRVAKVFINKRESGKLLAFADIMFRLSKEGDGCLNIKGWKLFNGKDGFFISPPSTKVEDKWYDQIIFKKDDPDADALRKHITDEVIKAYNGTSEKKASKQTNKDKDEDSEINW